MPRACCRQTGLFFVCLLLSPHGLLLVTAVRDAYGLDDMMASPLQPEKVHDREGHGVVAEKHAVVARGNATSRPGTCTGWCKMAFAKHGKGLIYVTGAAVTTMDIVSKLKDTDKVVCAAGIAGATYCAVAIWDWAEQKCKPAAGAALPTTVTAATQTQIIGCTDDLDTISEPDSEFGTPRSACSGAGLV